MKLISIKTVFECESYDLALITFGRKIEYSRGYNGYYLVLTWPFKRVKTITDPREFIKITDLTYTLGLSLETDQRNRTHALL